MPSIRNGLLLCTIPLLLSQPAWAQSNSCDLLKQTLAARIPPEIKGYAMDDVPSKTPVPPGGKVIGTCEGGARKVIYRRFGGPPLPGEGGVASGSAPAPAATPAPTTAAPPAPAPKPPPAPPAPPVKPVAPPVASAPVVVAPRPAPAPPPPPPPPPPSPPPPPPAPAKPAVIEKPAELPKVDAAPSTAATDEPGFFGTYGLWLWLLLALPLVAWLWSWVSHRLSYDSAGLPRGPRL